MIDTRTNLSEHFTIAEASHSDYAIKHGIDNTLPSIYYGNAQNLCKYILEPTRLHFGQPLIITSLYRGEKVNHGVGGSETSDHLYAKAGDIKFKRISLMALAEYIKDNLVFKQLILEPDWVHASWDKENNKKEVLTKSPDGYLKGLVKCI